MLFNDGFSANLHEKLHFTNSALKNRILSQGAGFYQTTEQAPEKYISLPDIT